eukprot:6527538-Pyramimonas_sp.AAC.1
MIVATKETGASGQVISAAMQIFCETSYRNLDFGDQEKMEFIDCAAGAVPWPGYILRRQPAE